MGLSFEDLSLKKLALILIGAGIVIVFAVTGFQARNVFAPSVTEEAQVTIKQGEMCVIEGSDRVPREIQICPYNEGSTVLITYKPQQHNIERHELK